MGERTLNLAVLLSGSGTTLQNLVDQIRHNALAARIVCVVGSRDGLAGQGRAEAAGLAYRAIRRGDHGDVASFSQAVFAHVRPHQVDLVCLAGWLCLLDIPDDFSGRVMNIHPALLPSFGGKGMYGRRVHQAVLDHGCKVSGCTVHFVDQHYDSGPIIVQRTCPVVEGDDADALAHRVFEQEKIAYPQAIKLYGQGKLKVDGRIVHIDP